MATAPIQLVAWEPPCAAGAAQEMAKRQKKKKRCLGFNFFHKLETASTLNKFYTLNQDKYYIIIKTDKIKDVLTVVEKSHFALYETE